MHGLFPPVVVVHDSVDASAASIADVPRARGLVLAVLGRGPGPGLRPQVATLQACVRAARDRSVSIVGCMLGRVGPDIVATFASERVTLGDDRAPLLVRWPEIDRTVAVPRGWIGRHLCLVVPCVGANAPRRGPLAAGLAALADALGVRDADRPCEIAAQVAAGIFAGVTIVVDADVAVVRARSGGSRPRLVPAHRIFTAHRVPAPASWLLALARGFDGWLVQRSPSPELLRDPLRFSGPLADTPWNAVAGEPLRADGPLWAPPASRRRTGVTAGSRPR